MHRLLPLLGLLATGLGPAVPSASANEVPPAGTVIAPATPIGERDGAPLYRKEILGKVHTVDRIYRSMQGPFTTDPVRLLEGEPELLWVTGYRAGAVAPDGRAPMGDEFMCHSNLAVDAASYRSRFPTEINIQAGRLATLSQGQLDIVLPPGFGLPVMSDYPLLVNSQVLNLNRPDADLEVRQFMEIDFVRDADLEKPLKPLFVTAFEGWKLVSGTDGYPGMAAGEADPEVHGPGCSIGEPVAEKVGPGERRDGQGRLFTAHWVVKPGREVNRTRVTEMLKLPYDTRAHAIASHMHPFGEYVELRDLTTDETVYRADIDQATSGIGLQRVAFYTSEEGIPLWKDHEYELVSVYDNTSGVDQDAMASMFLYLHGRDVYDFMLRKR